MAITLRYTATDTGGSADELTYQEMNDNFKSFYYSSSLSGSTLQLYTTGSVSHSVDLSSFLDNTNTNIYNTDGTLTANRTITGDGNDLTFNFGSSTFTIQSEENQRVAITGLPVANSAQVLGIDGSGNLSLMATSSIPGQGGTDTNLYNTNGTLTAARTVTANSNKLTFSFTDADFQISSGGGTGGDVIIADLRQASTDSMMMINAGTGVVSWMATSSLSAGGSTNPGGSDTQVQFNDGGSFGGDTGLTYNKTNNTLTIISAGSGSDATTTYPALILSSSDTAPADGDVLGLLAASNVAYGGTNYNAAIAFKADGAWGGGGYHSKIEFQTVQNTAESTKMAIHRDGEIKLNRYGSGSFTGTNAYYLAVSASGEVIETAPPGGFTRPGSATSVTYDTYFNGVSWSINSTTSGTPTANGNLSVNSTTPASVDTIKIYKNNTTGTNYSTVLENIAVSGSITLSRVSGGLGTATYKVISVTDNSTYVTLAVQDATGASGTYDNGTTTVDVDSDYEYELSTGYNRLDITNSSGQSQGFRLAAPAAASAGDKVIVEFGANASSANNIIVKYVLRSGTPSFIKVSNLYSIGDGTAYAISLDNNDVAYLEFTVFDNGSITGLLPTGAQQVIYA